MSAGYIEPDIYHAEHNELLREAEALVKEKQQLSQSIGGGLAHLSEAEKLQRFLTKMENITEYDAELFVEYVENITVQDRETFTFNMKCGLKLTERVVLE